MIRVGLFEDVIFEWRPGSKRLALWEDWGKGSPDAGAAGAKALGLE